MSCRGAICSSSIGQYDIPITWNGWETTICNQTLGLLRANTVFDDGICYNILFNFNAMSQASESVITVTATFSRGLLLKLDALSNSDLPLFGCLSPIKQSKNKVIQ